MSSSDFHLTQSSPARDSGTCLPDVPCDFDGNTRPAGSAYDIGAYEYGGSPGSGCSKGGPGPTPTPAPCTQYTSASQIPEGFGVPWDVTNPSIMLVKAECYGSSPILKAGNPNTTKTLYIYKDAYTAPSGAPSWTITPLLGGSVIANAWYATTAQGRTYVQDPTKPLYYVAYTCTWTGTKWMCGHMCLLKPPPLNCGGWFSLGQRAAASSLVTDPGPTVDGANSGLCQHG